LAALPEAHWSALSPAGPLRRWRLIELQPGEGITQSPLRIDENVLHYLTGTPSLDDRLEPLLEAVPPAGELPPSHQALAGRISRLWGAAIGSAAWPVIQLCGTDRGDRRGVAAAA